MLCSVLTAQSLEPALYSVSPSLSALPCSYCVSLSKINIKKNFKEKNCFCCIHRFYVVVFPFSFVLRYFLAFSFFFLMFIIFEKEREGERDREQAGKGKTERETQNQKQAPGSELLAQSQTWGSNSQTARS